MANLTATQLLKAITKANMGIMGAAEMRSFEHSLVGKLLGNQNEVFRNINALKSSDEQPTKAILFNRVKTASDTAKAHDHSGDFADTFEKDIAYIKRVQKFKVSYKQADNNQFGYDEILQHNLKNALLNLYEDISAYAVSWLDANKSQVGVDSLMDFDDTTNFQFDNVAADKDLFFDYLKASMRTNKYRPVLDVVGDQRNSALYRKLAANGTMNADNTAFQLPGLDYVEEEQIALSANGLAYAWQKGMAGMTTWNEPLNRRGQGEPGANEGFFTTMADPILGGMVHDLHIQRSIADTSGSAGNVQDVVDEYEITTIFTAQAAFESTADASPIFKFVQGA